MPKGSILATTNSLMSLLTLGCRRLVDNATTPHAPSIQALGGMVHKCNTTDMIHIMCLKKILN